MGARGVDLAVGFQTLGEHASGDLSSVERQRHAVGFAQLGPAELNVPTNVDGPSADLTVGFQTLSEQVAGDVSSVELHLLGMTALEAEFLQCGSAEVDKRVEYAIFEVQRVRECIMRETQLAAEPGARNTQPARICGQFTTGKNVTQRSGGDAIRAPTIRVGRVDRPGASQFQRLTDLSRLTQAVNPPL